MTKTAFITFLLSMSKNLSISIQTAIQTNILENTFLLFKQCSFLHFTLALKCS